MKSSRMLVAVGVSLLVGIVAQAADTASISGKVDFEGTAPKRKKIKTDADPKCAEMHADDPLLTEEVVVNANGTLKNVFVYIKSGLAGKTYEPPQDTRRGGSGRLSLRSARVRDDGEQPLKIVNSDDTLHNIHAMPTKSKEFNVGQPNKGMSTIRTFAEPEIMVHLKCDVHPWMSAYVGVMDNPFYSVTGDDGTFSIKGLPAGDYEVVAWHEKYGTQTQKIKVGDGEAKTVDFKFSGKSE